MVCYSGCLGASWWVRFCFCLFWVGWFWALAWAGVGGGAFAILRLGLGFAL